MKKLLFVDIDTYRADQVSSPERLALLWKNIANANGVVSVDDSPGGVQVEITGGLFDDSVRVRFAAYVRRI